MYFVGKDGKQTGPFSVDQLRGMASNGDLQAGDLIWAEGMADWKPAISVSGIFDGPPAVSTEGAPPPVPTAAVGSSNPFPPPAAFTLPPAAMNGQGGAKQNPMALTGMILGIFSVSLGMCCCYGIPFNIAGIVFSLIGLSQIKANPEQTGKGMAQTGLWCSIASIVLGVLLLVFGLAMNGPEMLKEFEKLKKQVEEQTESTTPGGPEPTATDTEPVPEPAR